MSSLPSNSEEGNEQITDLIGPVPAPAPEIVRVPEAASPPRSSANNAWIVGVFFLGIVIGWSAHLPPPIPKPKVVFKDRYVPIDTPVVAKPAAPTAVPPKPTTPAITPLKPNAPTRLGPLAPEKLNDVPPHLSGNIPFAPALPGIQGMGKGTLMPLQGSLSLGPDIQKSEDAMQRIVGELGGKVVSSSASGHGKTFVVGIGTLSAKALVQRLKQALGDRGVVGEAYPTASLEDKDSPAHQLAVLEKRLHDLKAQREKLLVDFYADAQPIREIDDQIAETNHDLIPLRRLPAGTQYPMRVHVSITG